MQKIDSLTREREIGETKSKSNSKNYFSNRTRTHQMEKIRARKKQINETKLWIAKKEPVHYTI